MAEFNEINKFDKIKILADYNLELIKFLSSNNIKFEAWNLMSNGGDYLMTEKNQEQTITIEIPTDLYENIKTLCKINCWVVNPKIIDILDSAVYSAEITEENGFKQVMNF